MNSVDVMVDFPFIFSMKGLESPLSNMFLIVLASFKIDFKIF